MGRGFLQKCLEEMPWLKKLAAGLRSVFFPIDRNAQRENAGAADGYPARQAVMQKRVGDSDVMRVLVVSDTHGNNGRLEQVLEIERPYDMVIHLGDIEGSEDVIEAEAGCPVVAVQGNNDFFSDLPEENIIEVAGKRIFITHGHYYYVAAGVERLMKEARIRDVDMVMFGHTHRPLIRQEEDLAVINPGSLSYPRQEGRRPSYVIMEIAPQKEPDFYLKFL